jgi:inosose dehydratase
MQPLTSRRSFLTGAGAAVVAAAIPAHSAPALSGAAGIRFGYAAITWGKDGNQAIEDISATGYEGIQLRMDAVTEFQPARLREILQQHKLTFVALSSGEIPIDPATEADQIALHTSHAKVVHDAGGLYLQVMDKLKTYPRTVTPEECVRLGKLLTELGKRTAGVGVPLVYHNHMNSISEHPANLDMVLENSDPVYVKLLFDTAHSVAGGGDPAMAIQKYRDRLLLLHIKDGVDIPRNQANASYPFKFVELGRGRVDLLSVFAGLQKVKYQGWAVVELDRVPDNSTTPRNSAMISRKFLEEKIGVKFPAAHRA